MREVARRLYAEVRRLPIISPHGHTDPEWFATDASFTDATSLLLAPDHYLYRMLYSQGVPLEALVRKFSHQRFEPSGFTKNPEIRNAASITDYVFRWLALQFVPANMRAFTTIDWPRLIGPA